MNIPAELRYSSDHEWVRVEGTTATIGITEYAQDALGDVVFVEMPDTGLAVAAGESFSEVESTKSVSDIYAPVTGSIAEVNSGARVAAGVAQQRSVRRRLDLPYRDQRPVRTRRPDGCRGIPSLDRGLT
jgi:glycine cleavage system H protein